MRLEPDWNAAACMQRYQDWRCRFECVCVSDCVSFCVRVCVCVYMCLRLLSISVCPCLCLCLRLCGCACVCLYVLAGCVDTNRPTDHEASPNGVHAAASPGLRKKLFQIKQPVLDGVRMAA